MADNFQLVNEKEHSDYLQRRVTELEAEKAVMVNQLEWLRKVIEEVLELRSRRG